MNEIGTVKNGGGRRRFRSMLSYVPRQRRERRMRMLVGPSGTFVQKVLIADEKAEKIGFPTYLDAKIAISMNERGPTTQMD